MRISALPLLVAGAGVAMQAVAQPIRVVVVSHHQSLSTIPLPSNNSNAGVAQVVRPSHITITQSAHVNPGGRKGACLANFLRHKAAQMAHKAAALSAAFRHALGMPAIEPHPHPQAVPPEGTKVHGGLIKILPMPFIGTPVKPVEGAVEVPHEVPHKSGHKVHHHHHAHKHGHHHASFLRRIHRALMALGPWEGRAVAFVLGCGIGVLLRMVWVMAVVTYRVIRGSRDEDEAEYAAIVFEHEADAEDLVVPPPQYTDEKVEEARTQA